VTETEPPTRNQKIARGADWAVTVVLICGQAILSLLVGFFSLLTAMVSDGCHDQPDDPFICSAAGERVFLGGLLAEWLLLAAGVVVSLVLALRTTARGGTCWPKPFVGTAVGVLGVLVMALTLSIVS
jgi:hypothetical protein